jgi:hypothetical protein
LTLAGGGVGEAGRRGVPDREGESVWWFQGATVLQPAWILGIIGVQGATRVLQGCYRVLHKLVCVPTRFKSFQSALGDSTARRYAGQRASHGFADCASGWQMAADGKWGMAEGVFGAVTP